MFQIVRHWKGGLYTVIGQAKHTERDERLVIYADAQGRLYARPRELFFGMVEGPRFADAEPGGGECPHCDGYVDKCSACGRRAGGTER